MEDHSRGSENPRSLLVSEWREILSTGASEVDKCQIGEPLRSKGASEVHHSHKKHPQNSLKTQRLLVPEPCTFHYCVGIRVADLLGSKLFNWQPFENFFGAAMENCKKRRFLLKPLLLDIFVRQNFFPDRTMWKLSSWRFRKCGTFWACDLSNGSYCCSKSEHAGKIESVTANRRC